LFDDHADTTRFALYSLPLLQHSMALVDDPDIFVRNYSSFITKPHLLLLAVERGVIVDSQWYGPTLLSLVDDITATPFNINVNGRVVCRYAVVMLMCASARRCEYECAVGSGRVTARVSRRTAATGCLGQLAAASSAVRLTAGVCNKWSWGAHVLCVCVLA
jgi:hypothetical protein